METILDGYNYFNCSLKSHSTHGICGTVINVGVSWDQVTDNRTPSYLFGG